MRFTIKITLYALDGISGDVSTFLDYDPEQLTMLVKNENGHPRRELNGTLNITGDSYDDIMSSVNTSPLVYGKYGKVEVYNKNVLIATTENIQLTFNDEYEKRASFKISGFIEDEYGNIFKNWDKLYNIYDTPTKSYRHWDFRSYESTSLIAYINSSLTQAEYQQTILNLCEDIGGYTPSQIAFSTGTPGATRIDLSLRRLFAYGLYENLPGTLPEITFPPIPPAGINWEYDSDVLLSGVYYPKYVKKPGSYSVSTWQTYSGATTPDQFINVEGFRNFLGYLDYSGTGRLIEDVIKELMSQIDSSILFDASSFSGLIGTRYQNMILMGMSDFIPAPGDLQKSDSQTVLNISIGRLLSWFEKRGFYWYLEESGGSYYFRFDLKYNQTLNTPTEDLTNYYNRNFIKTISEYNTLDVPFWSVRNETLSKDPSFVYDYSFLVSGFVQEPYYTIGDDYIFTDVNNVFDAKTEVYDDNVENFILASIGNTSGGTLYEISSDTSIYHPRSVVNFAMSVPYLSQNILSNLPTIYGPGVSFSADRLAKLKQTKLNVPLNNIYTDLDMFEYIENSQGDEMEIEQISQKLSDQTAEITFKL
jgi:hypothetical protein